jgi:hypothetical protein
MGVSVAFDGWGIEAHPGGEASCDVRVRNTGLVVDQILLDLLGDTKEWAKVEPAQLNLLPGTDGTVRVTFRPPRAAWPSPGEYPFALRAMSMEDPEGSVIEEGSVAVGAFTDVNATLVPRTSHARRRGRHRLIVENRGNAGTELNVSAIDPDDALEFRFRPEVFTAEPGTATFVKLHASPRKRFFKGQSKSLPFQAFVLAGDAEPVKIDGAVLQQQIMPEWLVPLLALATVAAAALVALWFLVLKPEVHAAATEAVNQQTHALVSSAAKASQAASQANQAAENADSAAATASGTSKKSSSSASTAAQSSAASALAGGIPVADLIQSKVAAGKTTIYPYKLTGSQTLVVSDLVLQNPAGDAGTMTIQLGSSPLFEFALVDFRDLDYHFVQPITFTAHQPLELAVSCKTPGSGSATCTAALSFSGVLHK